MKITDAQRDELLKAALEVRENAYAPYSNHPVGAAIITSDGRIFTGANVENASYGLSICAERTAIFKAAAEGVREVVAVAICTEKAVSPCGACRQVLVEFARDIPVWQSDLQGNVTETTLHTLLPDHFGPSSPVKLVD